MTGSRQNKIADPRSDAASRITVERALGARTGVCLRAVTAAPDPTRATAHDGQGRP